MIENAAADKRKIKKQRIKKYFLEAARDIITKEGVENVSVRKVADMAGYSYATIYNYFADLNELLWDVRGMIISGLFEYMQMRVSEPSYDKAGIKKLFEAYVDYYFENLNIFKFFYLFHLNKPGKKTDDAEPRHDYGQMWNEAFKGYVLEGKITEKDIEALSKIFIYSMHGMLTLSFSDNWNLSKEDVHRDLEEIVDYLL